ncbi:5-deoxy-glucuronate isomerase (plasmid) [Rhizobium leguminosarum]|uniref:5-deoxy-glucuronate isomerase n=1 Tax=Rhizobium beringeri TaxID=3019934 RepID=A0ABY1XKM0_9HYPH|nr:MULTISPECIES: 5-deoxy-glucuronate isomerase [Rhizobium]RWX03147.1 5-deoxy-glucuronate isomerase [Rhizobium leguminosarum]TAU44085.1 5-deoxy-glucuronate isomerase [Rhizobium leguminosarum]TBC61100.1 5-deoxy-glucuronate isomerase [Rhizobium leguminosarum]TBC87629.1 5-deoxy-glucuronate isomerase [Rhizobium leguminosarum]TBC88771.1 5-deoxy-glucuronate isomerase [Rhizobium leguminosarum]
MPEFIPRSEQRPIVDTSSTTLDLIYFDLVTLASNEQDIRRLPTHESLYVVLSGQVDIEVDDIMFEAVGRRADVWGGDADSVYAPVGANVRISARGAAAEVAIAGGLCDTRYAAFRITPDEVDAVNVGSSDTHSQRRIVHLLGQRQNGRCGNLLVSELYAGEGCWSGYPPHKHDTEDGDVETRHEELYHYRFQPETGFGSQITYDEDGPVKILMTRNGDTVLVDRGYHPTVTSPGHRGYIFTILVGKHRRGLIQRFDPAHQHLTKTIPGIDAMRDKFK